VVEERERQDAVDVEALEEGGALAVQESDPGLGLSDVEHHGRDGCGLGAQTAVEDLDGVVIAVGGDHFRARGCGDATVVARVASEVENSARLARLEEASNQALLGVLGGVAVGAGLLVARPGPGRPIRAGQLGQARAQPRELHELRPRVGIGPLEQGAIHLRSSLRRAVEEERQGHVEQHARTPALQGPEDPRHVFDRTAREARQEVGARVPAVMDAEQEREEEHLVELAEREPEIEARRLLEGAEIDEDRAAPHELDVEGGRVLERAARGQRAFLEVEGGDAGVRDHGDRPLVGEGQVTDRRVLEEALERWVLGRQGGRECRVRHEPGACDFSGFEPARQDAGLLELVQALGGGGINGAEDPCVPAKHIPGGVAKRSTDSLTRRRGDRHQFSVLAFDPNRREKNARMVLRQNANAPSRSRRRATGGAASRIPDRCRG
jgi:hypothetical protein